MAEIIEWLKTIGGLLVVFIGFAAVGALGIEIFILFSAGQMGWGFLALAGFILGIFFCYRYIARP
jgi:hypothetical protein